MLKWNTSNIPDQKGKIVIITGATSGLGKEATQIFASKNASVIMAVRNIPKGEQVAQEIKEIFPNSKIDVQKLDLNSLISVKAFADKITASYNQLDILINNAGVMACPFSKTEDGFEIQMGVNHLGPFALTGHLMPLLKKTKASRIVSTSSLAHRNGDIDFDDINWEKRKYATGKAYGDSKLANLYFTYELARKLKVDPDAPSVRAAHPGFTSTELTRHSLLYKILTPILSQKVESGVLPTIRAALDESAESGDYFGPSGLLELKGSPVTVKSNKKSLNEVNAKRLWDVSEKLTGVRY